MRFKKGDKVEVMNEKEVPVSWHTAKILSGNGHTYCVQYDSHPVMGGARKVDMVLRQFVRPCPPHVKGVESCIVRDIVEVFYEYSWNLASILKILGGRKENVSNKIYPEATTLQNQYLVRLIGCSQELIVDRSNIRMRQTWHDNKWILMGKSSEDVIASKLSSPNFYQKISFQVPQLDARNKNQNDASFWESPVISSRPLKRMSPYGSSIVEGHNCHIKRIRELEKEGQNQRVVATPVLEKG